MGRTTELRQAIKAQFLPLMVSRGFEPDLSRMPQCLTFRKRTPDKVYVCDIQWEKYGRPRFIVNFGRCGARGVVCHGNEIDPTKIFTPDTPERGRLAPGSGVTISSWFRQDRTLFEWLLTRSRLKPPDDLVSDLIRLFSEVEEYWSTGKLARHVRLMPRLPENWTHDR
jgi:hypothetical protein